MAPNCGQEDSTTQCGHGTFVKAGSYNSTILVHKFSAWDTAQLVIGWPWAWSSNVEVLHCS